MSRVSVLNNQTIDNSSITGNGSFRIFESAKFTPQTQENALEVVLTYQSPLPNPDTTVVSYQITALLETQDDNNNWHPFHYQFDSFISNSAGNGKYILRLDPKIFNLDEGVSFGVWDGVKTIALESKKQGHLPDDFRIVVVVHEAGYGAASAFQSVDLSVSYYTYVS